MEWLELKEKVYFTDGSLRDIYVHETTEEDWKKWAEYVNSNYKIVFRNLETEEEDNKIDILKPINFWSDLYEFSTSASIYLNQVCINTFFFIKEEIENDIDPKEIKSLEDHNNLIEYMTDISNLLEKEVILTLEMTPEHVLISVNKNEVIITH